MTVTDLNENQECGLCAVLFRCSDEFLLRVVPSDPEASSVSTLDSGGAASELFEATSPSQPLRAGVQTLRDHLIAQLDAFSVAEADRQLVLQPLAALSAQVGEADLVQVRRLLTAALRLVLHARWYETPERARMAYCVSRFACAADAASFRLLVPAACHALEREVERLDRLWLEQVHALQVQDVGWLVADAYLSARRFLRRGASSAACSDVQLCRSVVRQDSTPGWLQASIACENAASV